MPADHRVRLHEDEGGPPSRPGAGQHYPEHPIAGAKTRVRGTLQHSQLLPQRYVLEHNGAVSTARDHDRADDQQDQFDHGEILASEVRRNQRRMEFWRMTGTVFGERLDQLLGRPRGGRTRGAVDMRDATSVVGEHDKDEQQPARQRRDGEEIHGREGRGVVREERPPRLGRRSRHTRQ